MWWHSTALASLAVWLCIAVNQCQVNAQTWLEPAFISAGTPGISLETSGGQFGIAMKEEIPWPFKLVEINYDGNTQKVKICKCKIHNELVLQAPTFRP